MDGFLKELSDFSEKYDEVRSKYDEVEDQVASYDKLSGDLAEYINSKVIPVMFSGLAKKNTIIFSQNQTG